MGGAPSPAARDDVPRRATTWLTRDAGQALRQVFSNIGTVQRADIKAARGATVRGEVTMATRQEATQAISKFDGVGNCYMALADFVPPIVIATRRGTNLCAVCRRISMVTS